MTDFSGLGALVWVDWALLAVLLLSVLLGLVRGLVFELLALAGWVVAWFAAVWLAPLAAAWLPAGSASPGVRHAASFAACFLFVLIAWALLARLVRSLVQATPLSLIDRVLGAVFGLLRGGLLLLVLAAVLALTPAAQSADWRRSMGAAWLQAAKQALKPLLPTQLSELLSA
jgi:membrane protein required for colicin V production